MSRHLTELLMSEADDHMEVQNAQQTLVIERERRVFDLCQELEDRGRDIDWDYFGVEDEAGQLV
jgi:hypothetical protein